MLVFRSMLEANLLPDGSVAGVTSLPSSSATSGARESEVAVFPLDGLPCISERSAESVAATSPETWTGGFSFALWDRSRQILHAYRDHYGARPLYYHLNGGRLLLASELPSILRHLPAAPPLDDVAVMEYLATGVLTENRTFHQGVRRVPAASRLTAAPGGLKVERYWHPWTGPWRGSLDPADLEEEFRHLFRKAVARTLSGPEPTGVLLSGGPDSSAVLGMAARLARDGEAPSGPPRVALTMVFDAVRECDESERARETAALHGVPWRGVPVERHSPLHGFDAFLERFGEPPCAIGLSLQTSLLDAARREEVSALLDGHDADTLLTPTGAYLANMLRRLRWHRLASELAGLWRYHNFTLHRLARETVVPLVPGWIKRVRSRVPHWLNKSMVRRTELERRLRPVGHPARFEETEAERILNASEGLALEVARCLERMHGREVRHPFLDPDLVRFLVSIPIQARFRAAEPKFLLRRALAEVLTPAARSRTDKTNHTTYFDWSLRTHTGAHLAAVARRGSAWLDPYIDWNRACPMIQGFLDGLPSDRIAIWRLLALERWLMLGSPHIERRDAT